MRMRCHSTSVTLGLGYAHEPWEADVIGRWQSTYIDYQPTGVGEYLQPVEIGNYLVLNARVGYRVTDNLLVSVVAQQFNAASLLHGCRTTPWNGA